MSDSMRGCVIACCLSERKGERKVPQEVLDLQVGVGIVGDAHAGNWHRQVSLLANESVERKRARGIALGPGDFAENLLVEGLVLNTLPVGSMLMVGPCLLVVTQIGKECHADCEIRRKTGMCVMPIEGVFAVVVRGGLVRPGDAVCVVDAPNLEGEEPI